MATVALIDPPGWQCGLNVGLAYVAATARHRGHTVEVVDLNNRAEQEDTWIRSLTALSPGVIGYSIKTATFGSTRILVKRLKQVFPSAYHVAGGPHVSLFWREVKTALPELDGLVIGDGELAFAELLDSLDQGHAPANVDGLITSRTCADTTPKSAVIQRLDDLPFPEFEAGPSGFFAYPLVTSRGCPYNCSYCSVPVVNGRRFRARSVDSVVAELSHARDDLGFQRFEILDDTFTQDTDRCKRICEALISRRLRMSWSCPNGIRADRLDDELAHLMHRSGCHTVMIGVETANVEAFGLIGKGESLEQIRTAIRRLKAAGLKVGGFFIIGLPQDTFDGVMSSVRFAQEERLDRAIFGLLNPYPGTRVYAQLMDHHPRLLPVAESSHFSDSVQPSFETEQFTAQEMTKAFWVANTKLHEFYNIIPWRLSRFRRFVEQIRLVLTYDRENLIGYFAWLGRRCLEKLMELSHLCPRRG